MGSETMFTCVITCLVLTQGIFVSSENLTSSSSSENDTFISLGAESDSLHHRIVGGEDAYYGEFPYQLTLVRSSGNSVTCGASLLNSSWVITAAHCCDGMDVDMYEIIVGNHRLSSIGSNEERIKIKYLVMHPEYDKDTV